MLFLKTCSASAISAISSEPPVAISALKSPAAMDFMLYLETHKATYDPTANIIPTNDKRGGKADEREANEDNPALPDLALRFTDRGCRRRFAALSQACNFLFEFLGDRAIFHHHIGAGLRGDELSLLEIESIAVVLADLDQLIDEVRRLGILDA